MKQQIYTNMELYINQFPKPLPKPEVFVFEHDFSLRKLSEDETYPADKSIFKLSNGYWQYYEEKAQEFITIADDRIISQLLKPLYQNYLQQQ